MSAREIASAIRGRGFAVVEEAVPPELTNSLRYALLDLQQEDRATFGINFLHRIGQEGFVANIVDRHPIFADLINRAPLYDVVEELLGVDPVLYLYQGVIVPPGGGIGAFPWKWHCDLFHVAQTIRGPNFVPGVNVLIYLDAVDSRNGATWLVPGSQGMLDGELPFQSPEFAGAQVQLQAPRGAAVLFNPLLWHCAGANHTEEHRCAVKMLSVRNWMMPQMDYARSVKTSVLERLSVRSQRWLGHCAPIHLSFDELEAELRMAALQFHERV